MTAQASLLMPQTRVVVGGKWVVRQPNTFDGMILTKQKPYADATNLVVVVDEVGMMTTLQAHCLMDKYRNATILLVGDCAQLKPVGGVPYIGSHDYCVSLSMPETERLTEVMLSSQMRIDLDDENGTSLAQFLRDIRMGEFTKHVQHTLYRLSRAPAFNAASDTDALVIAFTNKDVASTNRECTVAYAADNSKAVEWFPVRMSEVTDPRRFYGDSPAGMMGPFCEGLRCVITQNIKEDGMIVAANNQPVVLKHVLTTQGVCADAGAIVATVSLESGGDIDLQARRDGSPPLRPAFAGTMYIVQGTTTHRRIFVNMNACTGDGLYVAFSRVKKLDQLAGISNYDMQRVIRELEKMQTGITAAAAMAKRARLDKQQRKQELEKRKRAINE